MVVTLAAVALAGCGQSPPANGSKATGTAASAAAPAPVDPFDVSAGGEEQSWVGLYSSPAEIEGFSGTVLAIERTAVGGALKYRMTFYSDVVSSDSIEEPEITGWILVDGDRIYVPQARGYYREGKPTLNADVTRYTRRQMQGRTVLLRDDALEALTKEDKLYDYGVLIKVADKVDLLTKLDEVKHESIKTLYRDAAKEWKDPFVHGPNRR
jgi:hypothetical protein